MLRAKDISKKKIRGLNPEGNGGTGETQDVGVDAAVFMLERAPLEM